MKRWCLCVLVIVAGCTRRDDSEIRSTMQSGFAKLATKEDLKNLATKQDVDDVEKRIEKKLYKDGKINPDVLPVLVKIEDPVEKGGPPKKDIPKKDGFPGPPPPGKDSGPPKNGPPPGFDPNQFSPDQDLPPQVKLALALREALSAELEDNIDEWAKVFTLKILAEMKGLMQKPPGADQKGFTPNGFKPEGPKQKPMDKKSAPPKKDSKSLMHNCPALAEKAEFYATLMKKKGELELRLTREKERLERDILRGTQIVVPHKPYTTTPVPWPPEKVAQWRQEFEQRAAAERESFCANQEILEQAFLRKLETEHAVAALP